MSPSPVKPAALRVNFGDHSRTIVAGLKQERVDAREIEGKQALFVVTLEPRRMRGVLSEGMLFDIGYAEGAHAGARGSGAARPERRPCGLSLVLSWVSGLNI